MLAAFIISEVWACILWYMLGLWLSLLIENTLVIFLFGLTMFYTKWRGKTYGLPRKLIYVIILIEIIAVGASIFCYIGNINTTLCKWFFLIILAAPALSSGYKLLYYVFLICICSARILQEAKL